MTKVLVHIIAILVLASVLSTQAMNRAMAQDTPCTAQRPPVEFQHEPAPYTLKEQASIAVACRDLKSLACAAVDTRTIYLKSGFSSGIRACLIAHEEAHLNGWAADHRH
mgnify:CR=1 FL=1